MSPKRVPRNRPGSDTYIPGPPANEAAERLHAFLNIPLRDEAVVEYHRLIDTALAAERRATVDRLAARRGGCTMTRKSDPESGCGLMIAGVVVVVALILALILAFGIVDRVSSIPQILP